MTQPLQPVFADLIWQIGQHLRDCLCLKLADTVAGSVCRCSLMSGDSAVADICTAEPGLGDGQAWVRMVRLFVSREFPRPIADVYMCGAALWAAEFEIGVLRCAVVPGDEGEPPTAGQLNDETAKVMDDAYVLRWVTECCLPPSLPYVPGEWQPISGGGCTGGRVTWTVQLVPGPHNLTMPEPSEAT